MTPLLRKPTMLALLLSTAALPGCTTYLTTRADPGTAEATYGTPYRLPMRQFTVEVTWQLLKCEINPASNEFEISIDRRAKISSALVDGEALVLDYQHMTNRFKTGSLEVVYWDDENKQPTRFIKTINAEIKGEEAEATKAGLKALGSLAGIGLKLAGLRTGGAEAESTTRLTPTVECNPDLAGAIALLKLKTDRLKEIGTEITQRTTRITLLQLRLAGGKLTDADMAEIERLNTEYDKLTEEKTKIEGESAKLVKSLSFTKTLVVADFTFAPDSSSVDMPLNSNDELRTLYRSAFILETADHARQAGCTSPACLNPQGYLDGLITAKLAAEPEKVIARVMPKETAKTALTPVPRPKTPDELRAASHNGFVYREPIRIRFSVERPSAVPGQAPKVIAEKEDTLPQFGRIRVLPLRSRWGEQNRLEAEFARDGTPTKITYKAMTAGGPGMVATAQVGIDEVGKVVDTVLAHRDAKAKEAEGAELQALKNEIELLTEQQKLAKLQSPSAEQAERDTEIARLKYEKERAELLQAIRRAGKD